VSEARKLNIPVLAITDTNCDPDLIDFVIPGNDDALRSIKLITARIADACVEGSQRRKDNDQGGGRDRDGGRDQGGPQMEREQRRGGREEINVYQGGRGGGPRGGGGGGGPRQ